MLLKRVHLTTITVMACLCAQAQIENVASIGAVKDKQLMNSWEARYAAQYPTSVKGWLSGANTITEILNFPGTEGIWTYKGVDAKGQEKIVFKAADAKGEVLAQAGTFDQNWPCPPFCNGNVKVAVIGARIDEALANHWTEAYQNQNKGRIYGYLMGKKILETMLSQKSAQGMYFSFGLDEKGDEHLVLGCVDQDGKLLELRGDNSVPCPPWCPDHLSAVKVARK